MNKKSVLESLLFVVGEDGLSLEQIMTILEIKEEEANKLIFDLDKDYSNKDRGLKIMKLYRNLH